MIITDISKRLNMKISLAKGKAVLSKFAGTGIKYYFF
jgi:hypothetical protein